VINFPGSPECLDDLSMGIFGDRKDKWISTRPNISLILFQKRHDP